jgi:hypothetical protein
MITPILAAMHRKQDGTGTNQRSRVNPFSFCPSATATYCRESTPNLGMAYSTGAGTPPIEKQPATF